MEGDKTTAAATPVAISDQAIESATSAIGKATERSQAMVASGFKTLETETSRYFEELSQHGREALEALARCEGPMDVLAAEQKWFTARAQAHLDLARRMAEAFADAAKMAAYEPAPGRPDLAAATRRARS
jgi:hypothetical protein